MTFARTCHIVGGNGAGHAGLNARHHELNAGGDGNRKGDGDDLKWFSHFGTPCFCVQSSCYVALQIHANTALLIPPRSFPLLNRGRPYLANGHPEPAQSNPDSPNRVSGPPPETLSRFQLRS